MLSSNDYFSMDKTDKKLKHLCCFNGFTG